MQKYRIYFKQVNRCVREIEAKDIYDAHAQADLFIFDHTLSNDLSFGWECTDVEDINA